MTKCYSLVLLLQILSTTLISKGLSLAELLLVLHQKTAMRQAVLLQLFDLHHHLVAVRNHLLHHLLAVHLKGGEAIFMLLERLVTLVTTLLALQSKFTNVSEPGVRFVGLGVDFGDGFLHRNVLGTSFSVHLLLHSMLLVRRSMLVVRRSMLSLRHCMQLRNVVVDVTHSLEESLYVKSVGSGSVAPCQKFRVDRF